ncbi:MAG: HAMP domain-containing histidine kinase [Burkholderiales bacterium]|nr:HAMP domain-containing histidine kinase [Burkholderiales bacterium]
MEPTDLDINTFLVASIHDMKNSLSVMHTLLDDAVHLVDDPESPASKQLGQALYESQRVNDNLIQLVSLYKINQKFYPFDPLEYDVADFAAEAVSRVAPLAKFRRISIGHDCPPGLRWYFDRELIFGAIVQALRNGMRYTRSKVHLQIQVENDMLEFRIEDDGPGYPPHMLASQPHAGLGVSFTTGSTGLGLYFSTVVARLHRNRGRMGTTRLDNGGALGGGVFVMHLP